MDFPPNSHKAKEAASRPAEKRVEQVTSATAVRRKKSLGKQFKSTFVAGDMQMAMHYVVFNVIIPSAKDMLAEAASSGIEKLIYGEARPGRNRGLKPPSGPQGHIAYNRMGASSVAARPPGISRSARARNDFDEIILSTRTEAEEVIERLFDLTSKYEAATLADLYDLVGIEASHTDNKWGWTDLQGSHVTRVRSGGYLLDLPEPEEL